MAPIDGVDNEIKASALDLIGETPIVALDRVYKGPGRILAKCEFMNPGASIKCRASRHMIKRARESGELKPGQPLIELTSGNQGCGLAVVSAVLGHPLTIMMSSGNTVQRVMHIEALGGKVIRVPQVEGSYGQVTYKDFVACEEELKKIVDETGAYFVNQLENEGNTLAHYETTGPEIWRQTGHKVDAFVAAVGTAGTFTGTAKYLKEQNPEVKCYVVEPIGAEAIKGEPITKPLHVMEGSSYGMVPKLFNYDYLDGTVDVSDEEVSKYRTLIGEKEGLFIGYTAGANVAAAVKLLESGKIPKDSWIVTVLPDTGLKYTPVPDELKKAPKRETA